MFEKLELTRMAQALMAHSGARLATAAQNVAHADTPGYRARDIADFAETYRGADSLRATRAGHAGWSRDAALAPAPLAGWTDPNGNSVSIEAEMVRSAGARQAHDMALAVYRSASSITRAALGRRE